MSTPEQRFRGGAVRCRGKKLADERFGADRPRGELPGIEWRARGGLGQGCSQLNWKRRWKPCSLGDFFVVLRCEVGLGPRLEQSDYCRATWGTEQRLRI